jgi:hypothetical protein
VAGSSPLTEKIGFEGKKKDFNHIEGGYRDKKITSKTTILCPFYPRFSTSILTLYFQPKNLRLKPTKLITKSKT